jgi:hypothetical protein
MSPKILIEELRVASAHLEDFLPGYLSHLLLEAANEIQMLLASNELLKPNESNSI